MAKICNFGRTRTGIDYDENAQNDAVEKQQKAKKKKGSSGVLSISGGYIGGYGEGDDGLIDFTSWDLNDEGSQNFTNKGDNNNNNNIENWDTKKLGIDISAPKKGTATKSNQIEKNLAPPNARFEVLSDRSKALIIEPGHRLKLDLRKLSALGRRALEKDNEISSSKISELRGNISGKTFSRSSNWLNKMIDNVNEYTITMDVKFNSGVPEEGFSLFQTALVHAIENKDGEVLISRSNGECHVGNNGGVGILGKYGNTVKSKIKVGKWHRIVISVKCVLVKEDDQFGPNKKKSLAADVEIVSKKAKGQKGQKGRN